MADHKYDTPEFLRKSDNPLAMLVLVQKPSGELYIAELVDNMDNKGTGTPIVNADSNPRTTDQKYVVKQHDHPLAQPHTLSIGHNVMDRNDKRYEHLFEITSTEQKKALLKHFAPLRLDENGKISQLVTTNTRLALIPGQEFRNMNTALAHGNNPFPQFPASPETEKMADQTEKLRMDAELLAKGLQPPAVDEKAKDASRKLAALQRDPLMKKWLNTPEGKEYIAQHINPSLPATPDTYVASARQNPQAAIKPVARDEVRASSQEPNFIVKIFQSIVTLFTGKKPETVAEPETRVATTSPDTARPETDQKSRISRTIAVSYNRNSETKQRAGSAADSPPVPMTADSRSSIVDDYLDENLGTSSTRGHLESSLANAHSTVAVVSRGVVHDYGDTNHFNKTQHLATDLNGLSQAQRHTKVKTQKLLALAQIREADKQKFRMEYIHSHPDYREEHAQAHALAKADANFRSNWKEESAHGQLGALLMGTKGHADMLAGYVIPQEVYTAQSAASGARSRADTERKRGHKDSAKEWYARADSYDAGAKSMKYALAQANIAQTGQFAYNNSDNVPTSSPSTPSVPGATARSTPS